MPPTLLTIWDAGDLEHHRHTGPRGLQDVQADDGAVGTARGSGRRRVGRRAALCSILSGRAAQYAAVQVPGACHVA